MFKLPAILLLAFLIPLAAFAADAEPETIVAPAAVNAQEETAIDTAATTSDEMTIYAALTTAAPTLSSQPIAQVIGGTGGFCLDCDTHADCDRLCSTRGYIGGACLRDLYQVCGIDQDEKICSCY